MSPEPAPGDDAGATLAHVFVRYRDVEGGDISYGDEFSPMKQGGAGQAPLPPKVDR